MPNAAPLPPLAIIAGPTASGKSALALALAERTGGIIVNADSAQVYRDLSIVSARPTGEDEARAEHRLYGYRDGAQPCSAADWAADARATIAEIHYALRLPILVGGTGLYIRTLLHGIAPVPPIDEDVRAKVRGAAVEANAHALADEDPEAAARLNRGDAQRIARALEVIRSTGRSILSWQAERSGGVGDTVTVAACVLLPPRAWLNERCGGRFARMMNADGVAEIARLLARDLDASLPVMRAIGVRDIAGFVRGQLTREQAIASGQLATRRYAKHQYTWFRNQSAHGWPRVEEALASEAQVAALAVRVAEAVTL